jgi:DNA repair exonuclease SbcCD ATPase subunit
MIPVALRITNFRSFKKTAEFVFPQAPGLYFMQGLNEREPQLEGNGAGKSSLWEALTWCIFGKTSRGLKAGEVGNWDAAKGTRVEFDFITPSGEECTLMRSWKPNQWRLYSTANPDDFEDLDKAKRNFFMGWLGLDYDPWLSAIMMAQNQPMFLDLKAEPKAALFSAVMGLDYWLDASGKASKMASAEDTEIRQLERRESEVEGALAALERTDFKAQHKEWLKSTAKRLDELRSEWAAYEEYSTLKEDLTAAEKKERKAREDLKSLVDASRDEQDVSQRAERELAEIDRDLAKAEQDEKHAEDHVVAIEDNAACSQCGQKLDAKTRAKHLADAEAIYVKAKRREADLSGLYEDKRQEVRAKQDAFFAAQTHIEDARKALRQAEDATAGLRRDKLAEDKRLDAIEDEAEKLEKARSPFADMIEKSNEQVTEMEGELVRLHKSLDARRHNQSIYGYWVRGFKELRLQQIAEALTELEIEVNSAVAALGLIEWELLFQVDRETAKGTLQRGFNVAVMSPHNEKPVPWEAWSGGEGQRLRIAGNMGLADLIRNRTGTTLNLEVWDEPTQGLSPRGVADLLESLAQRARNESRQIWIVDHRSYDFGGFAGTATIVKSPSGSRIRQSTV